MPFIFQDGRLVEISDAEFAAYTSANLTGLEVPAGGQNIQVTSATAPENNQEIINPNTANNNPGQTLQPVAAPLSTSPSTIEVVPVPGDQLTVTALTQPQAIAVDPRIQGENINAVPEPAPFDPRISGENVGFDIDPNEGFPAAPVLTVSQDPTVIQDETGQISNLRRSPETGDLFEPLPAPPDEVEIPERFSPEPTDDELTARFLDARAQGENVGSVLEPVPVSADPRIAGENVGTVLEPAPVPLTKSEVIPGFSADPRIAGENVGSVVDDARAQMARSNNQALPITSADWRVRLSLAKSAFYLYQAPQPGILAPLARTNGVIFPYTPTIETSYAAKYDTVDLTHSNYRGYFYKNSAVENVNIRCVFTAQDTREAEYLLAVIHFFRSVTKMFYGATDSLAGTPPPLVFLSGLGRYQFNNQPCVVSNFQYVLPSDVDYIRALGFNNYGVNLENRRNQGSGPPAGGILGAIGQIKRLSNNGLVSSLLGRQRPGSDFQSNVSRSNYTNSTYVPTKIDIVITLLPVQTRSQVSTQFSMRDFASGNLLKGGGFW